MVLPIDDGFCSLDKGVDIPFSISVYLLDSCKHGTVFDLRTYQPETMTKWLANWLENISDGIPVPKEFQGTKLSELFFDRVISCFKDSDLEKSLLSIKKENDIKSIKKLIEENEQFGKNQANALEQSLRKDEFPPYLWMEYNRINRTFVDVSKLLIDLIDRMYKLTPKHVSAIRSKNRLVKSVCGNYSDLIDGYFNAMASYFRLSLFLEVWSCSKETDFLTERCVWTFKKIKPMEFEPIFMAFHESVSDLRQAFLKITKTNKSMDFDKPTDWAFKQLVLMT